jgi:hypothetical protein
MTSVEPHERRQQFLLVGAMQDIVNMLAGNAVWGNTL